MDTSVPYSYGSTFSLFKCGVLKCFCCWSALKSIFRPCHSASSRRVVQTVVTVPRRAVAMLNPMPNIPKLSTGVFPLQPARIAVSKVSGDIPGPLSRTDILAEPLSEVGIEIWTSGSATALSCLFADRNPSTELSTSSARHRHCARLISPSIGKIRGSGCRSKSSCVRISSFMSNAPAISSVLTD